MTLYGYARVSVREPEDKNLDLQVSFILDEMEFTYDGILASMHPAGCTANEACLR